MEKKSNTVWIITTVLLILIIFGLLAYIFWGFINDKNENINEQILSEVEENINQNKKDQLLIKSEIYTTDLNQNNDKEETQINYYGNAKEKYDGKDFRAYTYNKVEIVVKESEKTNSLIVDGNFTVSNIVDISKDDHFSEIVLMEEVSDEQYKDSIFIEYDGKTLKTIKVNYADDSIKTYNYMNNMDKEVQYISNGKDGKMEISDGENYVTVISQLGKMEKYVLNESHEFELEECKLIYDKDFYQDNLKEVQSSIKVYDDANLSSESYGAQEVSNIEVLEVLDNWLKVKLKSTGVITFAYIDDIKDL